MAQIILDPGEVFEHIHPTDSTTTALAGEMSLTINGATQRLIINEPVHVPANTVHRMTNTGAVQAVGWCGHMSPE